MKKTIICGIAILVLGTSITFAVNKERIGDTSLIERGWDVGTMNTNGSNNPSASMEGNVLKIYFPEPEEDALIVVKDNLGNELYNAIISAPYGEYILEISLEMPLVTPMSTAGGRNLYYNGQLVGTWDAKGK